jgi:hypothetical protein
MSNSEGENKRIEERKREINERQIYAQTKKENGKINKNPILITKRAQDSLSPEEIWIRWRCCTNPIHMKMKRKH